MDSPKVDNLADKSLYTKALAYGRQIKQKYNPTELAVLPVEAS